MASRFSLASFVDRAVVINILLTRFYSQLYYIICCMCTKMYLFNKESNQTAFYFVFQSGQRKYSNMINNKEYKNKLQIEGAIIIQVIRYSSWEYGGWSPAIRL